jgi:hypothetical protein
MRAFGVPLQQILIYNKYEGTICIGLIKKGERDVTYLLLLREAEDLNSESEASYFSQYMFPHSIREFLSLTSNSATTSSFVINNYTVDTELINIFSGEVFSRYKCNLLILSSILCTLFYDKFRPHRVIL